MATPLAANPVAAVRDSELLLGTAAAPLLSSQVTVAATIYSFKAPKTNKVIIFVLTPAGGSTLTLKAGVYPPAGASGEGDYTTQALGVSSYAAITVDSARHMQKDGTIQFSTSGACTVWVVQASA